MNRLSSLLMVSGMSLVLTGCGGGGSESANAPEAAADSAPTNVTVFDQRIVRGAFDYDANGIADATEEFAYDSQGRQIQRRYVYSDDGVRDLDTSDERVDQVQDSTYDSAGNLLTNLTTRADGRTSRAMLQYGADGLLTRMEVVVRDGGGALLSQENFLYTYMSGRLTEMVVQLDSGLPVMRQTLSYGSDGLPAVATTTRLIGPVGPDSRTEYEWNSDNASLPGAATYTFAYDTVGRLERIDVDIGSNGSIDATNAVNFAAGACLTYKMPMFVPLVTATGLGSSADAVVNPCGV
jgi:uncharacterized lipoprotein YehR (DUF1307 family)